MTKRIILLIIASMAAGVCSLAQEVRFTADPAVKKIQVLDIQSTVEYPAYKDVTREHRHLYDDNLLTEWCASFMDKDVTQDVVFTLSEGHIGSFLIYSYSLMNMECGAGAGSYTAEKPCAAVFQLKDIGSGKVLGEYRIMNEKNTPFIAAIDKSLTPCQDGQFKIQLRLKTEGSFDENQFDTDGDYGLVYGSIYIRDISFWKDKTMNPLWPVGDRARFELRGPVKKVIANTLDNQEIGKTGTFEFDREGRLIIEGGIESDIHSNWHSFYFGDVAIDYGSEERMVHFVRRYDHYGRLEAACAHWDVPADYVEGPGWSGHYVYSEEGLLIESSELADKYYKYENGQLKFEHYSYDDWEGFDQEYDIEYTILSIDKYGNWTKRKCQYIDPWCNETDSWSSNERPFGNQSFIEEREIFYY